MSPLSILQLPAHLLWMVSAQHATAKTPLSCQVFLYLLLVERDALGLKTRDAVQPPGEQRNPFGQHRLEVSLRLQTPQDAVLGVPPKLQSSLCPGRLAQGSRCHAALSSISPPPCLPGLPVLLWTCLNLLRWSIRSCGTSLDAYLLHGFESRSRPTF